MQPVTFCAGTRCRLLVALMLIASISASANGIADDKMPAKIGTIEGVSEYLLDNGLKLLLIEDRSQPKVTVNCTVFVGARHDGYGESGMAHLLEHMLFKGTELHPRIADALNDRGADFNGSTGQDQTRYYETLTASDDNLEFAIRLEADRLINSKLLKEHLQTEATVVRSEFEMVESNPQSVLEQRLFSAAYLWHNYNKSIIGNKSDIESISIESLRGFYKKYYRPDNAMVIIAGNFDEGKTIALVQKYFGTIANPKPPLSKVHTAEPAQDGDRTTVVRRVGDVQMIGAAYHIPAGSDPEFSAVQLLTFILTNEPSGRLYASLIGTKKATRMFGNAYGLYDPGAILFFATVSNEKKIEDAQTAMIDTLEGLAQSPITAEEVDRARIQFLNYRELVASRTDRLAGALSDWAALGDWRLYFLHRDLIEKVTASQVQNAAMKYMVRSNRTVGLFLPTEKSESIEIPERANTTKLVAGYQGREAVSQGEQFDPTPKNIEERLVRGELKTGIPAAFLPKKTRGATVNVNLKLRFGDEKSLMGKSAAVSLLGSLMERGTKNLSLQQLNDRKDQLQAGISVHSALQTLNVNLETRRDKLTEALDLVADILRNPALNQKSWPFKRFHAL
jgi:zinc protease